MAAAPPENRDESFPRTIGPYTVLTRIASGGMGTVLLACRRGMGGFERDVAIKILHPHLRESGVWTQELLSEAKLAGALHHPNVAHVLDVGDDTCGVYLVMEYVEGTSLSGLEHAAANTGHRIPTPVGLRILCDALAGLHAAHELRGADGVQLGLVHRDFSPQNILVGTDGLSRLADFGIAKSDGRDTFTRTGDVKGKVRYMPPEQLRGETLDRRCDVWAAGVIAWQLVAGRPLFPKGEDVQVGIRILNERIPLLREVAPEASAEIERAVASALEPNRRARCPTAEELRRRIMDAAPVADANEVAEYVRERTEGDVFRLRARAAEARRARDAAPAQPAAEASKSSAEPATVTFSAVGQAEATKVDRATLWRGAKLRRALPIGLLAAAGVLVAFRASRGKEAMSAFPAAVEPATASTSSQAAPVPQPAPSSAASASADRAAASAGDAPERSRVTLVANAAVARLQVGKRALPIPRPDSVVRFTLEGAEASSDVTLEAISADGRRATHVLPRGETSARVVFPRAAPASKPPAPPAHPTLAPSPYGK